jgi:4-amino-4-deoxy-L-arabinose transferase-like glycosyltransferase
METKNISISFFHSWESGAGGIDRYVLTGLLAIAFLLRLPGLINPEVIHHDGIEYIRHAHLVFNGNWFGGKAAPLYPALIALCHFITPDMETAGILVSTILGSALILPVFYLGKKMFNPMVGLIAALFAAVHPVLIEYSGSVLSESSYYLFFTLSVLFSWEVFRRRKEHSAFLFGTFTALAYLTRPEAIGLLFVFSAWILFVHSSEGDNRFIKKIAILLTIFITFFAFSMPYLREIQKETGKWQISKKAALSIGSFSGEEEAPSFGKPRGGKGLTLSSVIKHPLPVLGRMGIGLLGSLYKFLLGLNPLLFFFALFGWIVVLRREGVASRKGNLFLLSHVIFYFGFVFPFFFISKRFASQMICIALPWAAFGLLSLTERSQRKWWKGLPLKRMTAFVLIILLVSLLIQGRVFHNREHRTIQREAGLWMKTHLPRGAIVMSRLPQEAFYSGMEWVRLIDGSYEETLERAQSKHVRYLITDDGVTSYCPDFLEKTAKESKLRRIHELKRKDQSLFIWELIDGPKER